MPHSSFRPRLLVAAVCTLLGSASHAQTAATAEDTLLAQARAVQNWDLPASDLTESLARIARQSGKTITADPALVQGKAAPAVRGSFTVEDAAQRALVGSGLVLVRIGGDTLTLRVAPPAVAQAAPSAAPQTDRSLGTVTVTDSVDSPVGPAVGYRAKRSQSATKTDTPLIETPQAISVVTRDQIDDRRSLSVAEAIDNVAGVRANNYFGRRDRDDFIIRGFTQSNFLLRDGLRQNNNFFSNEAYGLERIEVLKGPSSVLYGQLPPGGAVNLVSKRPTGERLREVEASYGSFQSRRLATDLGDTFGTDGDWSWRLTATAREANDFTDFVNSERVYIAPALRWQPSPATSLTLLALYQDSKAVRPSELPAVGTLLPNPNGSIPLNRFIGEPSFQGQGQEVVQTQIGYQLEHAFAEGIKFRQNLRYAKTDFEARVGFVTALQPNQRFAGRNASFQDGLIKSLAIDNQLQLDFKTSGIDHTLVTGVDYLRSQFDQVTPFGSQSPLDLFTPVYGSATVLGNSNFSVDQATKQVGLYLQDQIKFGERWVAVMGVRHDRSDDDNLNLLNNRLSVTDASKTTGRLGLVYLAPSGLAPYASYGTSFVPVSGAGANGSPFVPETGKQIEVGLKYEPRGAGYSITAAIYDLRRQNVTTTDLSNPQFSIQVGEQQHKGLELEATGKVLAGLNVAASFNLIDAKISRSNTGTQGNRPTLIPKQSISLWFKYDLQDEAWRGWSFGAGARFNGESQGNAANTLTVPGYALLDAAIYYRTANWRFALNAKNLADKRYIASCFNSTGAGCAIGEPRVVTATATYNF